MKKTTEKTCPKCNTSNPAEANFCRHCGYEFQPEKVVKNKSHTDASLQEKIISLQDKIKDYDIREQFWQQKARTWFEKETQYKDKQVEMQRKIEKLKRQLDIEKKKTEQEKEKKIPSPQKKYSFKKLLIYTCIFIIGVLTHKCSCSEHDKDINAISSEVDINETIDIVSNEKKKAKPSVIKAEEECHSAMEYRSEQSKSNEQKQSPQANLSNKTKRDQQFGNQKDKQLLGVFSVAPNKQVIFSPGNLQYKESTNEWRFAEHQWDYYNLNCAQYNGEKWVDIFLFGTSGFNGKHPCINETEYSYDFSSNISYTNYDWGWYNCIEKHPEGTWRTMNASEWKYICAKRKNAQNLIYLATVNNVKGLILLPDNWDENKIILNRDQYFSTNTIDEKKWNELEENGAVFLPSTIQFGNHEDKSGVYWSSSLYFNSSDSTDNLRPRAIYFDSDMITDSLFSFNLIAGRTSYYPVRLVRDK